jgi:hypothetical protein
MVATKWSSCAFAPRLWPGLHYYGAEVSSLSLRSTSAMFRSKRAQVAGKATLSTGQLLSLVAQLVAPPVAQTRGPVPALEALRTIFCARGFEAPCGCCGCRDIGSLKSTHSSCGLFTVQADKVQHERQQYWPHTRQRRSSSSPQSVRVSSQRPTPAEIGRATSFLLGAG